MVAVDKRCESIWEFRTRCCLPEIEAVIAGFVKEFQGVFEAMILEFMQARILLGYFNTRVGQVGSAGGHGPNQLPNTGPIG